MNIFTLAYNESKSTDMVKNYISQTECFEGMVSHIEEKLKISIDRDKLMRLLENGADYNEGGLIIGKTYAWSFCHSHNWEIFATEIPDSKIGRALIIDTFFKLYPNCKKFESTINHMVGEYSEEYISNVFSSNDKTIFITSFITNNIIGECLYQYAAAELGGKTDEKSTGTIFEFFDERLVDFFKQNFDVKCVKWNWYCENGDSDIANEYWVYAMLSICSGDEEIVNKTRKHIDSVYGTNIFFNVDNYSDMLCYEHRSKSSKVTDEQYYYIVHQIVNNDIVNDRIEKSYSKRVIDLWNEMVCEVYKIAREMGIDFVLERFSKITDVVKTNVDGKTCYELQITATCDELANNLDKVKKIVCR